MRGWFGKSQAQLDAEKALVAEQKRKAVEERNAVLKAKGIEKNPDFKTFDESFSADAQHTVEKLRSKLKWEESRKLPKEIFAPKANPVKPEPLAFSKDAVHVTSSGFLTPDKRKAAEAQRAKYMPARLAAEKKAAEEQAKIEASKKKQFEATVEAERQAALKRVAEKQKPVKLEFSELHETEAKRPVLSEKPVFAKRPEKTAEERAAHKASWLRFDTAMRINDYHIDAERRHIKAVEQKALQEALVHNMKKPAAEKVSGFGIWGDRRKAAVELKRQKADAALMNEALTKLEV